MVSRVYVPYGDGEGYAFGMGAAEQMAYDHVQKYAYTISEQGFINVVDLNDAANPAVMSSLATDATGLKLTDIELCPEHNIMLVSAGASDTVSDGEVFVYSTVQRADPRVPTLLDSITVGPLPDMILPNSDCTKVAVANEGEGDYIDGALVDPEGSVDIIDLTVSGSDVTMTTERVQLGSLTDSQLIDAGVHLPLPLDAMVYWDSHSDIAGDLNFSAVRSSYSPRMNLEPEYLSWSADDSKLYVNLQENNAIATIAVPSSGSPSFEAIHALGLKDHNTVPIDIEKDGSCNLATFEGFSALRMPDSIQAVSVDGVTYILTANEGDDKEYGDFEEKQKLKDVFDEDDGTILMTGMTATATASATASAVLNVASKMRVTVGSAAVDYTTSSAPEIQAIVAMGGRGMSIYRDTGSALALEWDSASSFETEVCSAYPWSFNGIQDEEFSPVNGVLYNTSDSDMQGTLDDMNDPSVDGCADGGDGNPGACPLGQTVDERSQKDGAGIEAIVAGVACGSLVAVTATEKQGVAFVYDITTPSTPQLLFVRHLSPASETKNPGIAYASRELGEVDPEAMVFLDAAHSPSGKAGVLFAGAWSGTMSFWEFDCPASTTDSADSSTEPADTTTASSATQVLPTATFLALPLLLLLKGA